MSGASIEELKARVEQQVLRLMEGVRELIDVVVSDIPAYLQREIRKVFVASVAFSETLTEADVKRIKAQVAERSASLSSALTAKLSDEALWVGDDVPAGEGKVLDTNAGVWAVLSEIPAAAEALLGELGFPVPEGGFDLAYKTPTWFIEGKYAPGMIDKYWTQLNQLRELQSELSERQLESRKSALESRWDGS